MKKTLDLLLQVIDALEDYEPKTDSSAYVARGLLTQLDTCREMTKCLVADEERGQ